MTADDPNGCRPIIDPGEPEEGPYCRACDEHWPCELERLRGELAEAQRVLTALPDPSSVEELREKITEIFGDPNEATVDAFLDFAWSETARIAGGEMAARWRAEDERDALKAAIDDTLWRMHQLRSWAYRELSGETQHNVLSVITNVWDCLDPDRTRGSALDAPSTPESPEEAIDE